MRKILQAERGEKNCPAFENAKDRAKSNLHNKKIKRLSRTSYGYENQETWKVRFYTEGDSASGSITKSQM
jgi:hypothetical protein